MALIITDDSTDTWPTEGIPGPKGCHFVKLAPLQPVRYREETVQSGDEVH